MSEAVVMAESSSYKNSINFYDRMSLLQGELKNYESQQFQLEEEFQRLWTQGISFQSPSEVLLNPTHTSSTIHLVEKDFDHLTTTRSQHLASPTLNYGQNEEMERRRCARNQALLDKLQELETNSSAFAARSERLRMMRNEYETLVRKYASYRTVRSSMEGSSVGHYPYEESFLGRSQSQRSGTSVASTGVNTDITGPVRPLSTSTDSLLPPERPLNIERPQNPAHPLPSQPEKILSAIQNSQRERRDDFLKEKNDYDEGYCIEDTFPTTSATSVINKRIKTRPTFLDISSTSESDLQLAAPKLKEHHLDNLDDTSADTTSLSVFVPKSRGSNYMPNISTDGSFSDTTSIKQPPIRKTIWKKSFVDTNNDNTTNATITSKDNSGKPTSKVGVTGDGDNEVNKKLLIKSPSKMPEQSLNVDEDEECTSSSGSSSDSTSNSIGDSVMDSVQNKTPDSLPKDDSELLHITEVDEEEEDEGDNNDKVVEKQHPHHYYHHKHLTTDENNEQAKSSALINEMGNQNQETWDNLSSSNLVRVAQKEIEIWNFGEGKVAQSEDIDQIYAKRDEGLRAVDSSDFDSNNKARTDNMESVQMKGNKPNLMNHTSQNILKDNKTASATSMLSLQSATSSSSLSSFQTENKNGTSKDLQKVAEDKRLQSVNKEKLHEIGKEESSNHVKKVEEHNNSKTSDDDFSSHSTKDFNPKPENSSSAPPLTNPFLVTSLQKESKQNAKTGNENKKLRLKFDYDDSESDHSAEGPPVLKAPEKATTPWNNLKSNNKRKDLFDDFFDI